MFKFLILPYLVIELIMTYYFINANGFLLFVIECIASAMFGLWLMMKRPKIDMANFARISPKYILSEFGFVIAGFLFAIPLVFSDLLGICALLVALFIYVKNDGAKRSTSGEFYRSSHDYNAQNKPNYRPKNSANDDIIDAEIIE